MVLRKFLIASVYLILQNVIFIECENEQQRHILMWTDNNYNPFYTWRNGNRLLIESKCPFTNCYVTGRRDFFGDNITKFDAIIFNGPTLLPWRLTDVPKKRAPHQKYIFLNGESSDNYPICVPIYDFFFNMTATYKLDSDIVLPYIIVKDNAGEEVGPRINMTWIEHMSPINQTLINVLEKKTKAAAWFVSNCDARSGRNEYAKKLTAALKKHTLDLDIYGKCGNQECPKSEQLKCHDMLEHQYFFYISFENSFSEDYVTEKVLRALQNGLIPIVYGGADYSRFLPPGSYLNARLLRPEDLAARMARIINTPAELHSFFLWRNHYTYHYCGDDLCRLCAVLNNKTLMESHKVYDDFRRWWNPNYEKRCQPYLQNEASFFETLLSRSFWLLGQINVKITSVANSLVEFINSKIQIFFQ